MDPLSGAGLAGTVVQFVQFAANLFNIAKEIHRSSTGISEEIASLEGIYNRLAALSQNLQQYADASHGSDGAQPDNAGDTAMVALAKECRIDCNRLLTVLERINHGQGNLPKWWKSFRSALKEIWHKDEIEALEGRISKHQTQLIMHMCMDSSERLRHIRAQMKHDDVKRHESFWNRVKTMESNIEGIKSALTADTAKRQQSNPSQEPSHSSGSDSESLCQKTSKLSLDDMDKLQVIKRVFADRSELRKLILLSDTFTTGAADAILQTIDYEERTARHESIPDAYTATFQWVFDKKAQQGTQLLEWLEKGGKVFWITGKPGAGKSTFIKFVADSPRTKTALRKWAGKSKPIIGCHYFWSSGSSIQKSRDGLLRSLLHDIFSEAPELLQKTCPRRWKRALSTNSAVGPAWSSSELSRTIFEVVKKAEADFNFCFFIDGLDEACLEVNDKDLCDTIVDLSTSPNVKLCISSRPWNRFTEYFGSRPTLSIQELTRDDIRNYTQQELSRHPRWGSLDNERGTRDSMVTEIVQRAQGVFLWVVLVVRQLREGLTNYDTSADLWKRLDRIPDKLTKFFQLIIQSVEPIYMQKMAETLLIAAAGQGPLHSAIYTFHDRCDSNPNYAVEEQLIPWNDEQLESEIRPLSIRLNSRCKGLLEVDAFDRVNFLHRTLKDFLQMEGMYGELKKQATSGFDAELSIFQAYICWIKHAAFVSMGGIAYYGPSKSPLVDTLETALGYAARSDSPCVLGLIDDLDWAVHRMFKTGQATFAGTETIQQTQHLFRTCILRTGLDRYPAETFYQAPGHSKEVLPLVSVLKLDAQVGNDYDVRWSARRVNLLQTLLDHGNNPNEAYIDPESGLETTPWSEFAKRLMPCPQLELDSLPADYPQGPLMEAVSSVVLSMLLDNGADPNALVEGEESPEPLPVWAKFFLACFLTPSLILHSDRYLEDLDKMVHKANLEVNTGFLQPLGQWSVGEPIEVVCRSLGVPVPFRSALWNILGCFLKKDPALTPTRTPKSYRELQLYAKVTKTFLRHDDLSKLPLLDIQEAVTQSMPMSLVPDILEGINAFLGSYPQIRPAAKRRRRALDEEGDEDMACGQGNKAPRLSFICNSASATPGRHVGRTFGETVRA
ncbi:hypothetical protein KVR01_006380 [Diaporthe batatas]|uniref:uncharacterized protein n=1 Tax=Diaporthe batatas TaxID=748121 RepID=UPI001D05024B|nr:uncharacterized protein KVR01_006380 [Diaporthe batatas]KAG8164462.1 hypothetical protein KVR01_006380 [Diaporthe batatas]